MKSLRILLVFLPILLLLTGCGAKEISAPENAKAAWSEDYFISVSWDESDGAEMYRLFRREEGANHFRFIADTDKTNYTDNTAKKGVAYAYKVKALTKKAESEEALTGICMLPEEPKGLSAEINQDQSMLLSWADDGAKSYIVYGVTGDGFEEIFKTEETHAVFKSPDQYEAYCVSGVHEMDGVTLTSVMSAHLNVLPTPHIEAVSRLDEFTNVIEIGKEGLSEAVVRVYRASSPDQEFELIGETREDVFYDLSIQDGIVYYYKLQAAAEDALSGFSPVSHTGYNQKTVFGVPVFMYHEFVTQEDLDSGVLFDEYAVWQHEFEEDLIWLRENGWTTITARELLDYLNGEGTLPDKPVILTIDDGKLGVYKNAYPPLEKYDMKAVLAVIGAEIDNAALHPEDRAGHPAPYCTWEEIGEMSQSGHVEIISHTYGMHVYRQNDGRCGADLAPGETVKEMLKVALEDYKRLQDKLTEACGAEAAAQAYPYSARSPEADRVWKEAGYSILFSGNSASDRPNKINYFIQDAGVNLNSMVMRRQVRMTGVPLGDLLGQESS